MRPENKQHRFTRVAEKRVQNVLDSIRRLSQCSNPRMYEWDSDQLKKIWSAIDQEYQNCQASYKNSKPDLFKLST
ncbi:hypothetical protein HQ531_06315 [bacterium]|nr:hypothetical protein [bacterium]